MKITNQQVFKEFCRYGIKINGDKAYLSLLDKQVSIKDLSYNLKKDVSELRQSLLDSADKIMEILREEKSNSLVKDRMLVDLFIYNMEDFYKFINSFEIKKFGLINGEVRFYLNQDISFFSNESIKRFLIEKNKLDIINRSISIRFYLLKLLFIYDSGNLNSLNIREASGFQGPWSYFDLPLSHRVVPYKFMEMPEIERQRQRQRRYRGGLRNYNTPDVGEGFYWREIAREPYAYSEMNTDSPYKTRGYLSGRASRRY